MKLSWYWSRLARMSVPELLARAEQVYLRTRWIQQDARPKPDRHLLRAVPRVARIALPRQADDARSIAATRTIAAAENVLAGEWRIFNVDHAAFGEHPDWFREPLTGRRAPERDYAFRIRHRDEAVVGNVKYLWEASRHHATTLLASAWWLTGDHRFAERAAAHLTSWWAANPFLQGAHWASPYESALRLIAWTWTRALLSDWPGCIELFDANDAFIHQLYFHQVYVARFYSRGSSRNNHVMTELAGIALSAVAFPWFDRSDSWAGWAYRRLAEEADLQTAADGLNREHAADYHRLVLELLIAATMAAELADRPLPQMIYDIGARMADGLAAMIDPNGNPPCYGDADNGHTLLLDAPEADAYDTVLSAASVLFGSAAWWPPAHSAGLVLGTVAAVLRPHGITRQTTPARPTEFAESGQSFLHADWGGVPIWMRCDSAALGYRSIAAHGHADALSFELRIGAADIFIDPGTYCYHGEEAWRRYFKGSLAHNSWVVDGQDQATFGGPFLWLTAHKPVLEEVPHGNSWVWQARHEGYRRLPDPVTHHRRIEFDHATATFEIQDWFEAKESHEITMPLHLGPAVQVTATTHGMQLEWGLAAERAALDLPMELAWTRHRGETSPPLGWMSRSFGEREPITTLLGRGRIEPGMRIATKIALHRLQ